MVCNSSFNLDWKSQATENMYGQCRIYGGRSKWEQECKSPSSYHGARAKNIYLPLSSKYKIVTPSPGDKLLVANIKGGTTNIVF